MSRRRFTVYRESWLRGNGTASGLLLNGQRCCLGFLGKACGIPDGEMYQVADPESVAPELQSLWPETILSAESKTHTRLCGNILEENDCDDFETDELREVALSALFADAGIDVTFADGSEPHDAPTPELRDSQRGQK